MALASDLGAHGRLAYERAVAALRSHGEDPDHCMTALELYARAVDDLAHYRRVWEEDGRPTTTLSEHGRELPHPMPKLLAEQGAHVAKLAKALGLDPEARHAMGRGVGHPPGHGQAADRRPGLRLAAGAS